MSVFKAQILTPEGQPFDGEVTGMQMPGTEGSFEVKALHASLISTLEIGRVLIRKPGNVEEVFSISGGFVEVNDNKLTLLAEAAEPVSKIDLERAKAAQIRAKERLSSGDKSVDKARARKALARAENRIKISASFSTTTHTER